MRRLTVFAVLCLVLLAQQRAYVHPLEHLEWPADETTLAAPHGEAQCAECSLLAGGFAALAPQLATMLPDVPGDRLVFHSYHSRASEVPAWFESRAPPAFL